MTGAAETRRLLARHGLAAKKARGQHFLVDDAVARRITAALDPRDDDLVFEIGPGLGALTVHLAKAAGRVVAVEVDRSFEPVLRERLAPFGNVAVRWEDARRTPWREAAGHPGAGGGRPKLCGNLPYGLTGPLVGSALREEDLFERIVFMVQREVAERMAAAPGGRDYGYFSLFVQAHAAVEVLERVPPEAFWPRPKVESAIVRLLPRPWTLAGASRERTLALARHAFAQRRKMLLNALAAGLAAPKEEVSALFRAAGIDGARRAETLTIGEFAHLAGMWREDGSRPGR